MFFSFLILHIRGFVHKVIYIKIGAENFVDFIQNFLLFLWKIILFYFRIIGRAFVEVLHAGI